MTSQPSVTLEYVRVRITADVELNTQPVFLAFLTDPDAEPVTGDFQAATWLGAPGLSRLAGVNVGPDGLVLAEGDYQVWWKVIDNPEKPVRRAGSLTIT